MKASGFLWSSCLLLCFLSVLVKGDAVSDLAAVQDAFFQWHQQQAPLAVSTQAGNKQYNDRLANLSLDQLYSRLVAVQQFINTASRIDRGQLNRHRQYSYDIFMDSLHTFVNNYIWTDYGPLNPINFLDAFYLDLDYIVDIHSFKTKEDFDNYISRLQAWPTQIQQMMARMDKAIQMGTTYHNVSVRKVPDQISKVINTAPQENALYRPFNATLDALDIISQQDKESLRSLAVTALEDMRSALGQLKTYFEDTYIPNTRSTYGVYGLPSGREYYCACLKWHLSVDLTPEEVHRTGLREVDRIKQLMQKVMTKQGFSGSIKQYYNQLKADPRFKMNSEEEVIEGYKNIIFKRINPKLPQLFKDIPPNRIEVKRVPFGPSMYKDGSEDGTRPGTFYASFGHPNETNTFSMVSLTLHEASPGHHLESVFSMKADIPPALKYLDNYYYSDIPYKFPMNTANGEGWALYAEYLGEEMGVYENDYEMMGRYGHEMFRACRLVLDTGMHYFGWDREKAIRYLSDHTPFPQSNVVMEIDRYLTWPGQACAYKIGELKIKEFRQKAAKALGSKFDVRQFHSLILSNGRMPLSVMETIVDDYIDDMKDHKKDTMPSGTAPRLYILSASKSGVYVVLASLLYVLMHHLLEILC